MPPLPNVPNVVKVQIKGVFDSGYNWANVLHFTYGGGAPTSADCATMAQQINTAWEAEFIPLRGATTIGKEVIMTDLSSSMGGEGSYSFSTPGTRTGGGVGGSVALLISKTVLARYRGGHPRSYLAIGTSTDLADEGHWATGLVSSAQSAYQTFIENVAGLVSSGSTTLGQECAVSYYETDYSTTPHTRIRRTVPVVYDIPIDGYTAQKELAAQRRRIGRKR